MLASKTAKQGSRCRKDTSKRIEQFFLQMRQIWYRWKALSVLSTEWSHPRAKNAYCDLQRPIKADIFAKYGAHSVAYWGGQTASGNCQLTKRRPVPATSFLPIRKIPFLSKVMNVWSLLARTENVRNTVNSGRAARTVSICYARRSF